MNRLSTQQVDDVFERLQNGLSNEKAARHLVNVRPSDQYELESMTWRYRLRGFIEGLTVAELIASPVKEYVNRILFGYKGTTQEGARPGKKYKYSVDILTEQANIFEFNVPAMNPYDAYYQLTKRIAYKSIPGIELVKVYSGFNSVRLPDSQPLKVFAKDELIYVTLL